MMMDRPRLNLNYLDSFVSGGIAGIISKSLVAPFDRIKILFQTTNRPFTYKEGWKEMRYICQKEGLFGFWRGNAITLLRVFPYSATQFVVFDFFQKLLTTSGHVGTQKHLFNFIAGSIAGISATIVTYPTEFIRTRMAMQRDQIIYRSLTDAVKIIYAKEGPKAFFRGMLPSFIGIIPCKGTCFLMFHMLRDNMRVSHPKLTQTKAFDFFLGASAGLISQLVAFPFDTVRKKMQAEAVLLEKGEIKKRKTVLGWTKRIIVNEGIRGLYKSVTVNMVKGPIANGACFALKNIFHKAMDKSYAF